MTATLEVIDVHRSLAGRAVLDGLTLTVSAGEVRALVGMNGAGKTTALRVILGMLRPDAGEVRVLGSDATSGRADRGVWARVGHLVETPFGYAELTARDNIVYSARLHGADPTDVPEAVARLGDVLRFTEYLDVPLRRLSLGTRQKVGIASACVHSPALLVLDEPTNALDPVAVVGLRELIARAAADGAAVLVTSHHFDEVARVARSVEVLHRGRIVDTLSPHDSDLERRFFDVVLAAEKEHGR